MLTVKEYSEKYQVTEALVYKGLYAKRIKGEKRKEGWRVTDAPPPFYKTKTNAAKIEMLDEYELMLLWLNGTVQGDAVILRARDEFVPAYFAEKFSRATWLNEKGSVTCKLASKSLVKSLRAMGFTGRQDEKLICPDIADAPLTSAFVESRTSLVRQLRYDKAHARDKAYAYYVPAISMCASQKIMERAKDALNRLGIIPERKLYPAANKTSATLKITSRTQLDSLYATLSVYGRNKLFWDELDKHISKPNEPYLTSKKGL